VEQQLAAGLREWQITQFIQYQEVEARDEIGGSSLALCARLGVQLVYQIDHVEAPAPPPFSDAGTGNTDGDALKGSARHARR